MASLVGRTLGGFTVEREIGRGGMGVVLLARQDSLGRLAVLKRIRSDLAGHPELLARFEREARSAAALHHHNVVAVYDLFQHRGAHYIAQEYVDGVDLASALLLEGPLPWRIAALVALEIARGLEEVHCSGTLHRDLKPANLLLGRRGEVKISDFGLALDTSASALTRPGVVLGTPSYMAPEQLRCERVDARSDVFSFGCVLYEMLVGNPPYPARQPAPAHPAAATSGAAPGADAADADAANADDILHESLAERIARERYEPVRRSRREVPRVLARLAKQCLRAKPKRRLPAARDARRALEQLLGRPSAADVRSELAAWLWQRGIFEPRNDQTIVLVADAAPAPARSRVRSVAAAAALAAATASLVFAISRPQWVVRATDAAAQRALAWAEELPRP